MPEVFGSWSGHVLNAIYRILGVCLSALLFTDKLLKPIQNSRNACLYLDNKKPAVATRLSAVYLRSSFLNLLKTGLHLKANDRCLVRKYIIRRFKTMEAMII
jgi:hypothetical protein